ncbi:MAG: Rnf-Nqr domain containing protein [Clostridia bacterium]
MKFKAFNPLFLSILAVIPLLGFMQNMQDALFLSAITLANYLLCYLFLILTYKLFNPKLRVVVYIILSVALATISSMLISQIPTILISGTKAGVIYTFLSSSILATTPVFADKITKTDIMSDMLISSLTFIISAVSVMFICEPLGSATLFSVVVSSFNIGFFSHFIGKFFVLVILTVIFNAIRLSITGARNKYLWMVERYHDEILRERELVRIKQSQGRNK